MTSGETSNPEDKLSINDDATLIDTVDVFNNEIKLTDILKDKEGVIIDFHRAAW